MNQHHIRAKVFLAAAERLEGVGATQTGAVRSAYREAADILKENATSERRLYLAERDSRWLSMDEGWDRIVEAQVRSHSPPEQQSCRMANSDRLHQTPSQPKREANRSRWPRSSPRAQS